jgi:hypothetical protein
MVLGGKEGDRQREKVERKAAGIWSYALGGIMETVWGEE